MAPSPYLTITSYINIANTVTNSDSDPLSFLFETGYDADSAVIKLVSTVGVSTWQISIIGTSGNVVVSDFVITQATSLSGNAEINLNNVNVAVAKDDFACIVKSVVNGGINSSGLYDPTLISTSKIVHKKTSNNIMCFGETNQSNKVSSYTGIVNEYRLPTSTYITDQNIEANQISWNKFKTPLSTSGAYSLVDDINTDFNLTGTAVKGGTDLVSNPNTFITKDTNLSSTTTNAMSLRYVGSSTVSVVKTTHGNMPIYSALSMFMDFKQLGGDTNTCYFYKCYDDEQTPLSTLYGVGVFFVSNMLVLKVNGTNYHTHIPVDFYNNHKIGITMTSSQVQLFYDRRKFVLNTTLTRLNQGQIYLGGIGAATVSYGGLEVRDFRVWNAVKADDVFYSLSKQNI